jgi:hypothetical protein
MILLHYTNHYRDSTILKYHMHDSTYHYGQPKYLKHLVECFKLQVDVSKTRNSRLYEVSMFLSNHLIAL